MSEIISGKEALIAIANGEVVEFCYRDVWDSIGEMIVIDHFMNDKFKFRLKPRTISINGIEVPAPFKPDTDEWYWYLWDCQEGYSATFYKDSDPVVIGAWRTEDEIKQVVEALRSIFK